MFSVLYMRTTYMLRIEVLYNVCRAILAVVCRPMQLVVVHEGHGVVVGGVGSMLSDVGRPWTWGQNKNKGQGPWPGGSVSIHKIRTDKTDCGAARLSACTAQYR